MEPSQVEHEPSEPGRPSHLRLGEILIRRGLIDQDDLALGLAQQDLDDHDLPLGRLLVNLGAISDETLTSALAEQSGLAVVDLEVEINLGAGAATSDESGERSPSLEIHLSDDELVAPAPPEPGASP